MSKRTSANDQPMRLQPWQQVPCMPMQPAMPVAGAAPIGPAAPKPEPSRDEAQRIAKANVTRRKSLKKQRAAQQD
ncbi:MAG: hypothetical protein ABWY82_06255 [Tardiphaga sp.]